MERNQNVRLNYFTKNWLCDIKFEKNYYYVQEEYNRVFDTIFLNGSFSRMKE